jgi:hypothetical protein|tara:strand:+ start:200 stop:433 length:234 start_codon:yes stop_codon:yes gene_type:complete
MVSIVLLKKSLDIHPLIGYNTRMDNEDYGYEYDEGSDVDNWEDEQVFQDHEGEEEEEFWEPEPREDFGFFGEAGLWD